MSSALWWVMNGRAAAPPGIACIMGVSTSRKPRSSRWRRIARMTSVRARKSAITSGLLKRSTYRLR